MNTSWGGVAKWYEHTVGKDDSYHKELIYPYLLRMASPKKGEQVIDIACGEGSFAYELLKKECVVCGVDISKELIDMAKLKSPQGSFLVLNADDLSSIKEKKFDKAFIILALQNIKNANQVICEVSKILKEKGRLYIVLNHPCFRIPQFSHWGWDDKVQYRRIDKYMSEIILDILMRPGFDSKIKTTSFHRPLQYFFKAFNKAGLSVIKIEEWVSQKESEPGPRAVLENRARKEIPLFMAIEAFKYE